MLNKYPESVKVLLRFKGNRQYTPGEIIGKEELKRVFKLNNLNGLIWNNQVEVLDTEPEIIEEGEQSMQHEKKRGRKKI